MARGFQAYERPPKKIMRGHLKKKLQTDISSEDTHHPAMQAAGNAKGKKCKAAEDSGQEGWKEGVGSLHKVQQLAKRKH